MTLTKADIAQKIANDCGFMRGEPAEILEKLLDNMKKNLIVRRFENTKFYVRIAGAINSKTKVLLVWLTISYVIPASKYPL